jgi:hypothetical protein
MGGSGTQYSDSSALTRPKPFKVFQRLTDIVSFNYRRYVGDTVRIVNRIDRTEKMTVMMSILRLSAVT